MKRTEPSKHLYAGHAYRPSWTHVPRTTWLNRLGGHFGLCPAVAERNAASPAVLAVVAALLLSACGGGEDPKQGAYSCVVSGETSASGVTTFVFTQTGTPPANAASGVTYSVDGVPVKGIKGTCS